MNKKGITLNLFWKLLERCGNQGISLLLNIILARILAPDDFGTLSIVLVIINLLQVFVDSGIGNAIIQKQNVDDKDYSSILIFNLILSAVMYTAIYFSAPFIATFLEKEQLTEIIRIASITIMFSAVKNVFIAYISINMEFKKVFLSTFISAIISATCGIVMALNGFGVWSLIAHYFLNILISTIILVIITKLRFKITFSFTRLKGLFKYGWKIFVSNIIMTLYDDLTVVIIGKKYSTEDLAYYDQGRKFPQVVASNVNTSIDSILFPSMSKVQDDSPKLKELSKQAIKVSCFVLFPIFVGMAASGETLIRVVLTDKWLFSLPFLYVFCFYYILYPFNTVNLNIIKSTGKSNIFLRLEIIKKVYGLIILLICMNHGTIAIAAGLLVCGFLDCLVNGIMNKKYLNYGIFQQFKDIFPIFIINLIMGLTVYGLGFLKINMYLLLFIQVISGILIYLALAFLFKIDCVSFIISKIKKTKENN